MDDEGSMGNRSNRTAANRDSSDDDSDDAVGIEQMDLANILRLLIRRRQERYDDSDSDALEFEGGATPPRAPTPDPSKLASSDLAEELRMVNGHCTALTNASLPAILRRRELGTMGTRPMTDGCFRAIHVNYLPNKMKRVASFPRARGFCGQFTSDGRSFISAWQDQMIRCHDARSFTEQYQICARDVGWSVLDLSLSPDGQSLAYCSVSDLARGKYNFFVESTVEGFATNGFQTANWSDYIHVAKLNGSSHDAFNVNPHDHRFALFSICYSANGQEIVGGANDGYIYVLDLQLGQIVFRVDGHEDDLGAVHFGDASGKLLFSGGDDGLVKVWDRRTLCEENPAPVGTLAGHGDGVTSIDSKGDGRYLISNSKDQSIKLWDIRRLSSSRAVEATKRAVAAQPWDYRWQGPPRRMATVAEDSSLMTYRGHRVLRTLIRCYFSPAHQTDRRYILTGCASGALIVYDVLSGRVIRRLHAHRECVRDASWHPYLNQIVSTSWDGTIGSWQYQSLDLDAATGAS